MRTVLLFLLLAMLSGCSEPASCNLVPLATMNLDLRNHLMFVTAEIGGQPVRMLVDTGAERTILTQAAVARLGLPHDTRHVTRSYGVGGASANWDVFVPGVVLGHTRFPIQRLAVGDFTIAGQGGQPVDGLLGADILLAFDLDIDAPERRLTLYRVRRCPDAVPPWPQPAIRVKGVEARRDRLMVPFQLDGVDGMAVLDTGAQATAIGMRLARRLGISPASLKQDGDILLHGAAPQAVTVHMHRFKDLVVADAKVQEPVLAVVPEENAIGDGLLGGDFLRGRRVWLSLQTHQLFVSAAGMPMLAGY